MPTIASAIACGMRSVVSTWANSSALATMNISMMVTLADSSSTCGTSFIFRSRYTNTAMKKAYTAATAAASVGVNTPP